MLISVFLLDNIKQQERERERERESKNLVDWEMVVNLLQHTCPSVEYSH